MQESQMLHFYSANGFPLVGQAYAITAVTPSPSLCHAEVYLFFFHADARNDFRTKRYLYQSIPDLVSAQVLSDRAAITAQAELDALLLSIRADRKDLPPGFRLTLSPCSKDLLLLEWIQRRPAKGLRFIRSKTQCHELERLVSSVSNLRFGRIEELKEDDESEQ